MNAVFKATMLFFALSWSYMFYVSRSSSKRTAEIEKIASAALNCESDDDCTSVITEADFCGRAKKMTKASKKNPRYDQIVLLASRNTAPGALDKVARSFFRDCLSISESAKVTCVEQRCK